MLVDNGYFLTKAVNVGDILKHLNQNQMQWGNDLIHMHQLFLWLGTTSLLILIDHHYSKAAY